jgi:hypothetical protein
MEISIKNFASISQALICLFVSIILYFIHLREKAKTKTQVEYDRGVFWLAAAVFLWSIAGIVTAAIPEVYSREFSRILLSTINSACFIIAVAYFDYGPSWLKFIQQDEKLRRPLVLVASVIVGLICLMIWLITGKNGLINGIDILDVILAVFTLYVLALGLEQSFRRREFKKIIMLSKIAILLVVFAQFLDLNFILNYFTISLQKFIDEMRWLIVLVSKTLLMAVILTHIISWKIEEEEELYTGEPRIRFLGRTGGKQWEVILFIPTIKNIRTGVRLTDALHRHLLWFAYLKKFNIEDNGYIYLLECKSDDGRPSFKSQLDRIMDKILESYISKRASKRDREALLAKITAELFNQKPKAYQLKLKPQNILIYSKAELSALAEFDGTLNELVKIVPD